MKALRDYLRLPALFSLLIGVSGCGLSDYENRMDAQRKRVQDFDEFNRLLGEPVETPVMDESAAWPFDVFLRLPKGYGVTPRDKTPYLDHFPFFRYAGGSEGAIDLFIAAAWLTEGKQEDAYLKYSRANFRIFIQQALERYYAKTNKIAHLFQEKNTSKRRDLAFKMHSPYADPEAPAKVGYRYWLYTDESLIKPPDQSAFDVYIHEQAGRQCCIVVHRPLRPAGAELTRSIEACLGSLDIGPDAAGKRALAKKAKGH
jgi:hypothetical protein